LRAVLPLFIAVSVGSCLHESNDDAGGLVNKNPIGPLRIYSDPYSVVMWDTDQRLLAQHHDHNGASASRLAAYDRAGYHVVPLMDYSGAPKLPYALKDRLWPVESWVDQSTLEALQNIRLLIPGAEEVGISSRHFTSPFLTDYIEHSSGAAGSSPALHYSTETELADLIRSRGGLPIRAHPWSSAAELIAGPEVFGMEIYSAYIAAKRFEGSAEYVKEDRNARLLANWDAVLSTGRRWVGVAVNDHYGPYSDPTSTDPSIRDSGKILVLARDATLTSYRDAFERGAFFAIRDNGLIKGGYPEINSISVGTDSITIDASGATEVRWISTGMEIGTGPTLLFASFPSRAVYVRAEILGDAHVIYTQAFVLRHVDDIDGDGRLTSADETLCDDIASERAMSTPEIDDACAAKVP
jgi:hypothetical protein